jgi:hypothetical protein
MYTCGRVAFSVIRKHLVYDFRVTCKAGALGYAPISRLDPNRLVKVFQRERQRMIEPIICLRKQCAQMIVGKMTVVTDCNVTVARILPRVIVSLHDMAIRARRWIVAEITPTFAVTECKRPDTD